MDRKTKTSQNKNIDFWESTSQKTFNIDTKEKEKNFIEYDVMVNYPNLRIRREPSLNAEIVGIINDKNTYHIIEENNGFGKLEKGKWIMLQYTVKI